TGTIPVTAVLLVPASNHVHEKQPAASTGERVAGQGVQWTPEPVLDRDGEPMLAPRRDRGWENPLGQPAQDALAGRAFDAAGDRERRSEANQGIVEVGHAAFQ